MSLPGDNPPLQIEKARRRRNGLMRMCIGLYIIVLIGMFMIGDRAYLHTLIWMLAGAAGLVTLAAASDATHMQMKQEARIAKYLVCPHCMYDLRASGLDPQRIECPECGDVYTREELADRWED